MSDPTEAPPKRVLSAADIAARAKPAHPPVEVDVPEWGGVVHVRRLSVADLDRYYARVKDIPPDQARAFALGCALCTPGGHRLYTEAEAKALADVDAAGAERVLGEFFAANGIGGRRGN